MSTQRQPKGIPVGGQFAANSHDEAGSYLPSESIHMFSVAGREYGIEKTGGGDDEYHVIQIDDERRPEIAVFESSSDDEDEIEDEARTALAEARGDNLDSAERLELGVGTVTIRLEPGDREHLEERYQHYTGEPAPKMTMRELRASVDKFERENRAKEIVEIMSFFRFR